MRPLDRMVSPHVTSEYSEPRVVFVQRDVRRGVVTSSEPIYTSEILR